MPLIHNYFDLCAKKHFKMIKLMFNGEYNGNGKKWHNGSASYGQEKWKAGDVIGCAIDMDKGQIRFSSNGKDLGVAFENINKNKRNNNDKKNKNKGDEMTIQPALTLWRQTSCTVVFDPDPPTDHLV